MSNLFDDAKIILLLTRFIFYNTRGNAVVYLRSAKRIDALKRSAAVGGCISSCCANFSPYVEAYRDPILGVMSVARILVLFGDLLSMAVKARQHPPVKYLLDNVVKTQMTTNIAF